MKLITDSSNPPAGHYSSAVVSHGFVFLSGVLPTNPPPNNFEEEVKQVLSTCRRILAQAECEISDVVQCTAYIVGIQNWHTFNEIYASFFGSHKPARTVVPVTELHHGCLVEIQMNAALPVLVPHHQVL